MGFRVATERVGPARRVDRGGVGYGENKRTGCHNFRISILTGAGARARVIQCVNFRSVF